MYSMLVISEQSDKRNMMRIHRRHLRDTTNAFEMPGQRFRELYRFTKATANILLEELSPYMKTGVRNTFIPKPIRMCAALHFFATGSFQRDIGEDFSVPISRTMVSRSVKEISVILQTHLMPKWIKFPSVDEYDVIKQRFYNKTGFAGVIGAIGCTHVRIKKPKAEIENCYLNSKGYHSKNVQLICTYDLRIIGGFARFGGAAHDAYIWEASQINVLLEKRYEENLTTNSWLLGHSGYPLRPWLMTPYRSSSNPDERKYNTVHSKTRNCIERLNGNIKGVFRCLQRGIYSTPQAAGLIINACTTLHNFRIAHGLFDENETLSIEDVEDDRESLNNLDTNNDRFLREAERIRNAIKLNLSRTNEENI